MRHCEKRCQTIRLDPCQVSRSIWPWKEGHAWLAGCCLHQEGKCKSSRGAGSAEFQSDLQAILNIHSCCMWSLRGLSWLLKYCIQLKHSSLWYCRCCLRPRYSCKSGGMKAALMEPDNVQDDLWGMNRSSLSCRLLSSPLRDSLLCWSCYCTQDVESLRMTSIKSSGMRSLSYDSDH